MWRTGGAADGRSVCPPVRRSACPTPIGNTVTACSSSPLRWLVRSKARIELMVSPHHSSRDGLAMPNP